MSVYDRLEGVTWLFRGVPAESEAEVKDVDAIGEVRPPRPERIGERWRDFHLAGATQTGYTSWTTDLSIAVAAAESTSDAEGLSGLVVIFRVRIDSISEGRLYEGREDEEEWLIEGPVEDVTVSHDEANDEQYD